MPSKRRPKYQNHKATGQARVRIDGRDFYLGQFGSAQSHQRYDELISKWLRNQDVHRTAIRIDDLCLLFLDYANAYYRRKDGTPTGTVENFKSALRYLVRHFGTICVYEFGPKKLKTIREFMIKDSRCRTNINRLIGFVRQVFRWGVEEELVPPDVYHALTAVQPLRAGRSAAIESNPIRAIDDEIVEKTIRHLPSVVADMVRFQRLTGSRPTEVCLIRPCDIDRRNEIWIYTPVNHKTQHHNKKRTVLIGPQAQSILSSYLERDSEAYCFSPADSERQRRSEQHKARKTPIKIGNQPGSNRVKHPKRIPREHYDKHSYARAVRRACEKAILPPAPLAKRKGESKHAWRERLTDKQTKALKDWEHENFWSPNQLRHTMATETRRAFGLEAAQVVLGHSRADVTQIYAERDLAMATEIISKIG